MHDTEDPLSQVRQMIAYERQAFARDVDGLLTELRVFSASLGDAIGDVSRDEAIRGMRAFVLEKFDLHLPLGRRSLSEVLLLQVTDENAALRQLLQAASHALRSYEHGSASTALAKEVADAVDARLGAKAESEAT